MENQILTQMITQGVFAVLFTYLLLFVLRENGKREQKYQELLKSLSENYDVLRSNFCDFKKLLEGQIRKAR
jgi:preprotein translocase subunit YajC